MSAWSRALQRSFPLRLRDLSIRQALIALLLALACMADVRASLPAGLSGAWYNPAQSGHGLTLEMLDDGRALGFWFVYDLDGDPVHLYLDGRVEGRSILAEAWHSSGMRFGSFLPSEHRMRRWGDVEITFSDCDTAQLRWAADGEFAPWGGGEMALVRLSRIAGLVCDFDEDGALLEPGLHHGRWDRSSGSWDEPGSGGLQDEVRYPLHAAVDRDRRLWAAATWTAGMSYLSAVPLPPVFVTTAAVRTDDGVVTTLVVRQAGALQGAGHLRLDLPLSFVVDDYRHLAVSAGSSAQPLLVERVRFERPATSSDPLMRSDYGLDDLAGRQFTGEAINQFFRSAVVVRVSGDGTLCVDAYASCELSGEITAFEPGMSMFSFELRRGRAPTAVYRGKGWVREDTGTLVLVGHDGDRGLGLVLREGGR